MSVLDCSTMVVAFPDPPRPRVVLTPGQFHTRSAYRCDPLLAACVVVEQPTWRSRLNGEHDGTGLWKLRQPTLPPPRLRP